MQDTKGPGKESTGNEIETKKIVYNYTRFDRVQVHYLNKTRIKLFLNVSMDLLCVNYV